MNDRLLLDTCAVLWLGNGDDMDPVAMETIRSSSNVLVSPITAWEIGLLNRRDQRRGAASFQPEPSVWLDRLMSRGSLEAARFDIAIALESTALPGDFHNDPADRFIVATARILDAAIVTRDRKILAYAEAGHVRALAC